MITDDNFKVDFIGLGAPRAASSWIYYCLKDHPEICMSSRKETGYFTERNYRKGIKFYSSFFNHCRSGQLKGDSTPPYLFEKGAAERIKQHNPDAKFYVCLRNPVDRAYSSYFCHLSGGNRAVLFSFEEALKEMESAYIRPSMYYTCLKEYFDRFPKENILILLYDDLKKDPLRFIQDLYGFLGVGKDFVPRIVSERVNLVKEGTLRGKRFLGTIWRMENFFRRHRANFLVGPIYNFFRFRGFKIWKGIKDLGVSQRRDLLDQDRPPLRPETKEFLQKIFRPEIEKIEEVTGRDLSAWKE